MKSSIAIAEPERRARKRNRGRQTYTLSYTYTWMLSQVTCSVIRDQLAFIKLAQGGIQPIKKN
jgi:hypothetical protein